MMGSFKEGPPQSTHAPTTHIFPLARTPEQFNQDMPDAVEKVRSQGATKVIFDSRIGARGRLTENSHPLSAEVNYLIADWGDKSEGKDGVFELREGETAVLEVKGGSWPQIGIHLDGSVQEDVRRGGLAGNSMHIGRRKRLEKIVKSSDQLGDARRADHANALQMSPKGTIFIKGSVVSTR